MRVVLLFGLAAAQDHDHHHAHGHGAASCGCEKGEADHPFKINCKDADTIRAAAKTIKEDCGEPSEANCKGKLAAGDAKCVTAFFVLQAHHDYCDHDTLLTEEEKFLHDWEAYCIQCQIFRGHDKDLETCPMVDCEKPKAATDAKDLLVAKCTKDTGDGLEAGEGSCCTTDETKLAFRTVIAYHDLCAHDDIPQGVEEAVHDYEHACEKYMCNVVKSGYDGTKCEDDYADEFLLGKGWIPDESAAGVLGVMSAALLLHA